MKRPSVVALVLLSCCRAALLSSGTSNHPVGVQPAAVSLQQILARDEALVAESLRLEVVGRAGSGHYGSVLLATREQGESVAVKVEPHPSPFTAVEATVLGAMDGAPGFPRLLSRTEAVGGSQLDALVMERLGPSLQDVWEETTASTFLPGPRVLCFGRSILRCLRRLHGAGFVHNDVKPNNCLLGAPGSATAQTVHLIDFGLATRAGVPTAADGRSSPRGTPLFASTAAHAGEPTHFVHDLESLTYCLAYLAAGSLPWERKPPHRAAALKRRMLVDGCATLVDSCAPLSDTDPPSCHPRRGALSPHSPCDTVRRRATPRDTVRHRASRGRCTADKLTEHVLAVETVDALQTLWIEVVAAHAPGACVDYDACLDALGGGSWDDEGE
jgi:serine/threonine protein kinase